mmetsp:Transcript_6142/g.13559  ORF Transcript_6142/g.13559 Transcript_6142/m.13559 type:complete len:172 (-) Transcript_6142:775-1290(-)
MEEKRYANLDLKALEIKDTLGTGSFGRVRLVKVLSDGKFFALKILKKSEVIYLKQVEHVKTEKKILDEIEHPYIVNMCGSFMDDKNLYLLLEYIIGGEFFSHLRKAGRFPNDTSVFYSGQVHQFGGGRWKGAWIISWWGVVQVRSVLWGGGTVRIAVEWGRGLRRPPISGR